MLVRMCGKDNTYTLPVRVKIVIATMEISLEVPQKAENQLQDPAKSLLEIHPKDSPYHGSKTCSSMFIMALFIIYRNWNHPRCHQLINR